jgi:site-specific DNA-methyltransferase (cytosine-N4-specific)
VADYKDFSSGAPAVEFTTVRGNIVLGDSLRVLQDLDDESVDLIVTSPPFGLVRKKEYGNVAADEYIGWFRPFAEEFRRVLKQSGSLVIDVGGAWNAGLPTRHLYHFELLIHLCRERGFHLAQEFYWWNPAKLPSPAEWVNVRRIRVKDAVNTVWWLSKSEWPKADNRRVLQRYSSSMADLLRNGYRAKLRPSGHNISTKFGVNNGGAIPPNLLAIANTESNSNYQRYCRAHGLKPHPARFPAELPEFFVRMLTDEGDVVIDPFAGSCVTGEVCERLRRLWTCIELRPDYVEAAKGRFVGDTPGRHRPKSRRSHSQDVYEVSRPNLIWDDLPVSPLPTDGGQRRADPAPDEGSTDSDRNAA